MAKKKKVSYLILIIIAVVVGIGCLGAGIKIGSIGTKLAKNKLEICEKTLDYYAPIPEEVYTITGTIASVGKDEIVLKAVSPTERMVKGQEPKMIDYKIKIDKNTKITKTKINIDPRKSKTYDIKLGDLKKGDKISVRTKENIVNAENNELTATLIDLSVFPKI